MGIKEQFDAASAIEGNQEKFEQQQENEDPLSHLGPGRIFDPKMDKQRARRAIKMPEMLQSLLSNRVDASGDKVLKVSFSEFTKMRVDPEFDSFVRYGRNLRYYANGQPRPMAIRPILTNEVGVYRGKIVCLKDAGPDDVGEGKYFSGFDIGQSFKEPSE